MIQARIYNKWRNGAVERLRKHDLVFLWRKRFWNILFEDFRWLSDDYYETEKRIVS